MSRFPDSTIVPADPSGWGSFNFSNGQAVGNYFTTPSDCTSISSIMVYMSQDNGSSDGLKGVIWNASTPWAVVAVSAITTPTTGAGWYTLTFTGATVSPNTQYYFGFMGNSGAGGTYAYYNTQSGYSHGDPVTAGTYASPGALSSDPGSESNEVLAIYVNYTAGGGGATVAQEYPGIAQIAASGGMIGRVIV